MNEISRCCRLLGVKSGATLDEVKKAYRDLVQVWHPDRFSGNERLQEKAQEQLKQINLAYEFLAAHAFENGTVVEPLEELPAAEPETMPESEPEPPPRSRKAVWFTALGVIIVLGVAAVVFAIKRQGTRQQSARSVATADGAIPLPAANNQTPTAATNGQANPPEPPPSNSGGTYSSHLGANPPYSKDILGSMVDLDGNKPPMDGDLAIMKAPADNPVEHIRSDHLVVPPFVIRATVRLGDLNEFRVYCGMGRLIFNTDKGALELLVNNYANGNLTRVPHKGLVMSNAWHEIAWEVTETTTTVAVDREVRYREDGNFTGIKGYPGIGPGTELLELKSFVVESQQPPVPTTVKDRKVYAGNLIAVMAPESNIKATNEIDGLTLTGILLPDRDNRFKTVDQYHPPFTIRTRAKTDSTNLRLYCGAWTIVFNRLNRCGELSVKDAKKEVKVKDKGLVTPNEWHYFVWTVQDHGMTVDVDGQQRYHNDSDLHNMQAKPGIGTLLGSRVTVDYFVVEPK